MFLICRSGTLHMHDPAHTRASPGYFTDVIGIFGGNTPPSAGSHTSPEPMSSEPLFFFARRSMAMAGFAAIQLRTAFQPMGSASGPAAWDARCSLTRAVASVMPAPASTTAMMS